MARARDLLHKTHLTEFRLWLELHGYVNQTPKGDFEVLRMRHTKKQHPLLVYDRIDAPEHYTTHGDAYCMAQQFYRVRRAARAAAEELTQQAQDWGMYEQENLHNGDPIRSETERHTTPISQKD